MNKNNVKELQQKYDELIDQYTELGGKLGLAMEQERRLDAKVKELKESLEQEKLRYAELFERYIKMMEGVIKMMEGVIK